jgi:phosphoheptose isomerase
VSAVPAIATGDIHETASYVADHVRSGDAVVTLGIGTSYKIAAEIAASLSARPAGERS